jgi:hypothetical protein
MPSQELVHINLIVPSPHQPRAQVGEVTSLVNSILDSGMFHTSLTVKRGPDGKFILISGHRRLEAMRQVAGYDNTYGAVPVIIYEQAELDPITEWKMMIDENREREPLKPVEEARAFLGLKLRMDCEALAIALGLNFGARAAQLITLADWQQELSYLTQEMARLGRNAVNYHIKWAEFETYAGIANTNRKRYWQLAAASVETQEYLLTTNLPLMHQVAIASAPQAWQLELAHLVGGEGGDNLPLTAVQAAARTLYRHPEVVEVGMVLNACVQRLAEQPQLGAGNLAQAVAAALGLDSHNKRNEADGSVSETGSSPVNAGEATGRSGSDAHSYAGRSMPDDTSEEIGDRDTDATPASPAAPALPRAVADIQVIRGLESILEQYRQHADLERLRYDLRRWLNGESRNTGPLPLAA